MPGVIRSEVGGIRGSPGTHDMFRESEVVKTHLLHGIGEGSNCSRVFKVRKIDADSHIPQGYPHCRAFPRTSIRLPTTKDDHLVCRLKDRGSNFRIPNETRWSHNNKLYKRNTLPKGSSTGLRSRLVAITLVPMMGVFTWAAFATHSRLQQSRKAVSVEGRINKLGQYLEARIAPRRGAISDPGQTGGGSVWSTCRLSGP